MSKFFRLGWVWVAEQGAPRITPGVTFHYGIHNIKQRKDHTMIGAACLRCIW
jgi:hypothetical protein